MVEEVVMVVCDRKHNTICVRDVFMQDDWKEIARQFADRVGNVKWQVIDKQNRVIEEGCTDTDHPVTT